MSQITQMGERLVDESAAGRSNDERLVDQHRATGICVHLRHLRIGVGLLDRGVAR